MSLLVTGAMGHVGYEVARQAVAAGMRVVAPYHDSFRGDDVAALGSGVSWVPCDLTDRRSVERLVGDHAVDACIHLAAVSNEAYALPQPLTAVQANVGATATLLDLARRQAWRCFILVSTGGVFQNSTDPRTPILETATPEVVGIYGTTKYCAELLTRMYRTQFDLPAAVVRISWVYGPPIVTDAPTRGPIPSFLKRALAGVAVHERSGADFAASFTFVGDAAAGLLAAVRTRRLNFEVYHLGAGVNFTAAEVAAAIRTAVPGAVIELGPGTEPWTTYTRLRGPLAGDRLQRDTGFTIAPSLDAGVRAYADWMQAHPALWR
jgi:nucleoside-diphosphate-sugar epimerase